MKQKAIAIMIILLVITLPLALAAEVEYDEKETGESIIVNVKSYEPEIIPSSIIEDDSVNVYAYLRGSTLGNFIGVADEVEPFYSQPVIENIIITPRDSESRDYLLRSPRVLGFFDKTQYTLGDVYNDLTQPDGKSLEDLATLVFTLKQIEIEDEIPDRIDLKLQAEIWFSNAERFPYLLQQDLIIPEDNDEQKWREELPKNSHEYSFFSGRGFLRAEDITGNTATVTVYGGDDLIWPYTGTPRPLRTFTLNKGQISDDISMWDQRGLVENAFRVKYVDDLDPSEKKAEIEITKDSVTERRIVTEGMRLYPGSTFVVKQINVPKNVSGITEYSILIRGKEYNNYVGMQQKEPYYGYISRTLKYFVKDVVANQEGTPKKTVDESLEDPCDNPKNAPILRDDLLSTATKQQLACTAILELKEIIQETYGQVDESGTSYEDRSHFMMGQIYRDYLDDNLRALDHLQKAVAGNKGDFLVEAQTMINELNEEIEMGAKYEKVVLEEGGNAIQIKLIKVIDPTRTGDDNAQTKVIMKIQDEVTKAPPSLESIKNSLSIRPNNLYSEGFGDFKKQIDVVDNIRRQNNKIYTTPKGSSEIELKEVNSIGELRDIWQQIKETSEELGYTDPNSERELNHIDSTFVLDLNREIITSTGKLYSGQIDGKHQNFYIISDEALAGGSTTLSKGKQVGDYLFSPKETAFQQEGIYNYNWRIKRIETNRVVIEKVYFGSTPANRGTITDYLEPGSNMVEGKLVVVDEIVLNKQGHFTIIPGTGEPLKSVSNFELHIPIEKRPDFLLPDDKIDSQINKTEAIIKDLDQIINKMDEILKTWKIVCLGTFAFMTLKNSFLSGFSRSQARQNIMRGVDGNGGWVSYCKTNAKNYGTYEKCMTANSQEISSSINDAQKVIGQLEDDMENYESQQWYQDLTGNFSGGDEYKQFLGKNEIYTPEELRNYRYYQLLQDTSSYNSLQGSPNSVGGQGYNLKSEVDAKANTFKKGVDDKAKAFTEAVKVIKKDYPQYKTESKEKQKEIFVNLYQQSLQEPITGVSDYKYIIEAAEILPSIGKEEKTGTLYAYTLNHGKVRGLEPAKIKDYLDFLIAEKAGMGNVSQKAKDLNNEYNKVNGRFGVFGLDNKLDTSKGVIYKDSNNNFYITQVSPFTLGSLRTDYADGQICPFYPDGKPYCIATSNGNYVKVLEFFQDGSAKTIQEWNVGPNGQMCDGDDVLVKHNSVLERAQNDGYRSGLLNSVNSVTTKYEGDMLRLPDGKICTVSYQVAKTQKQNEAPGCYDVMDPSDCDTLFGVCDPVMCPPSRFNMGGTWQTDNVVQTGIIGSLVLGIHNFGPKEPVPICLTGIQAGLQNIRSYLQGYASCLKTSKVEGKTVGICDKIKSVYMCELLVREVAAIFKITGGLQGLMSKILYGREPSGGGEYLTFDSSLQNVADSVKFFTQDYAQTAFVAFQGRSTEEIGTEICKQFVHGKVPLTGDIIEQLTNPESPPQFTALLTEMKHSETQRQSRYQIFYHIYAGESYPVDYQVFLRNEVGQVYYATDECRGRSSTTIAAGGIASHTIDCITDSGFKEICVNINGELHCGFGKATTEFSLNYMNDLIVQDEVGRQIVSEKDCSPDYPSTSPSLGSMPLPGSVDLLQTGIIRVCSVQNPGQGTNPNDWKYVGTCGEDPDGRPLGACWIDMRTISIKDTERYSEVKQALDDAGIERTKAAMGITNLIEKEESKKLFDDLSLSLESTSAQVIELIKNYKDLARRSVEPTIIVKAKLKTAELLLKLTQVKGLLVYCSSVEDCKEGEKCEDGICKTLPDIEKCGDDEIFDEGLGYCVINQCEIDDDCAGRICINNECVESDIECQEDGDCGKDDVCRQGVCSQKCFGGSVYDSEYDYCLDPDTGEPVASNTDCITDQQCPNNEICVGNKCSLGCSEDGECTINEVCREGRCGQKCSGGTVYDKELGYCIDLETDQPECFTDNDCKVDELCEDNKCAPFETVIIGEPLGNCLDNSDCEDGAVCRKNKCVVSEKEIEGDDVLDLITLCGQCTGEGKIECTPTECHNLHELCYYLETGGFLGFGLDPQCKACNQATECSDFNLDPRQCKDTDCTINLGGCIWNSDNECVEKMKPTIILDPGHGGQYNNAAFDVSNPNRNFTLYPLQISECTNSFMICEKDSVLDISLKLKQQLENMGYNVIMTRDRDKDYGGSNANSDLSRRITWVNQQIAEDTNALFVSLHINSKGGKSMVFYPYSPVYNTCIGTLCADSKRLSEILAKKLGTIDDLGKPWKNPAGKEVTESLIGTYPETNFKNLGVLSDIRTIPRVLIETTRIDNPKIITKDQEYMNLIAQKIADGIDEYVE